MRDEDLRTHLIQGHTVKGYLLFDWFVTDAQGDCDHDFSLDTSLHVLWRVGQRDREASDSAPRWYEVARQTHAYLKGAERQPEPIGLYGEWEPGRPRIGSVSLPPGEYHVRLDLTEESFHANLDEENPVEGGGLWAWVLESDLRFTVGGEERLASVRASSRRGWLARALSAVRGRSMSALADEDG